jgi:hypothetical protein
MFKEDPKILDAFYVFIEDIWENPFQFYWDQKILMNILDKKK